MQYVLYLRKIYIDKGDPTEALGDLMLCCRNVYMNTPVTENVIEDIRVLEVDIIAAFENDDMSTVSEVFWSDHETERIEEGPHTKTCLTDLETKKITVTFALDYTPWIEAIFMNSGYLHFVTASNTFYRSLEKMKVQLN